ncbi:RagB/SusD family nutrient uptake outer membrane protein [Bacteroides sp.]
MKTIFKRYITALAMTPLLLSSCSESFLEEINPNEQTTGNFWVNEEAADRGLAAAYNQMRHMTSGYYGGYEGILHLQMRADDLFPTRGEEASTWETLSFTNTPNSQNVCWGNLYNGIQLANEFLYYAPNINMDQTKLSQMLGEAYFLRGFQLFQVRLNYNEGVIRTLPQSADPEAPGLSSPEDLMKQVISDLTEAKNRLPKDRDVKELGRITKGAAIAMLGKAYFWTGDYAAAKAEFETIMTSPYTYDLTDKYEDNFRDDTEFNKESIWEINYANIGDSGDTWGDGIGSNAFMGNNLSHYFGPSLKNNTKDKGECVGGGWYKMQPSPYLIKQFVAERRPAGADSKWDKRMYTTCFFKYSDYNDVKADETFYDGFDVDSIIKWTLKDNKWTNGVGGPAYPDIEGKQGRFLMKKFASWWSKTGCSMYNNPTGRVNNFRIMRFAEVLFLHAEACLQTNDVVNAMKDINRIRVRAGLPEKQLSDPTAVMEELRNQKLLEFAGENVRWYDLIRWYPIDEFKSLMVERKKDTQKYKITISPDGNINPIIEPVGEITNTQNFANMEKKHFYFPIPQSEVDANHNLDQKADWK